MTSEFEFTKPGHFDINRPKVILTNFEGPGSRA